MRSLAFALPFMTTAYANIFTISASKSGSPFDGQIVQASGLGFFLGLSAPSAYCPHDAVGMVCPNATQTVLTGGGNSMWVETPNGQQVYVATSGAISYTTAEASGVPTGGIVGGFFNLTYVSDCSSPKTVLNWLDATTGSEGILACPDIPSDISKNATYQIYAKTAGFALTDCTELDGLLPTYTGNTDFGAWEYV